MCGGNVDRKTAFLGMLSDMNTWSYKWNYVDSTSGMMNSITFSSCSMQSTTMGGYIAALAFNNGTYEWVLAVLHKGDGSILTAFKGCCTKEESSIVYIDDSGPIFVGIYQNTISAGDRDMFIRFDAYSATPYYRIVAPSGTTNASVHSHVVNMTGTDGYALITYILNLQTFYIAAIKPLTGNAHHILTFSDCTSITDLQLDARALSSSDVAVAVVGNNNCLNTNFLMKYKYSFNTGAGA